MATHTLANSPNPHRLLVGTLRPFAPPEFLVFPTGKAEYHWRILVLASHRTISRHKSLTFALRKCVRLNGQRGKGDRNETK